MYKLKGKVQHYAWGGEEFIPSILNIPNPEKQKFAEYWMGAHPNAPSIVQLTDNAYSKLPDIIRSQPKRYLGEKTAARFGELPYLLKLLDVKEMLSIQVHPTKSEAEKGFQRENEEGIPLDAPNRNYKDSNHKPEVMVALSDFWLLHGFLTEEKLIHTLESVEELSALLPLFETKGYFGLYKYVMELPQEGVDKILQPLAKRILPLYEKGSLSKNSPEFWTGRVLAPVKGDLSNLDRGIFSIYFFNLLYLQKGQGIFQGAGVPHAYLEGQNMELMSNSDNVLRGGITPKHIDVPELLKHTLFEGIVPSIMDGKKNGAQKTYRCPVPDFIIHKIELGKGEVFNASTFSAEIWFITEGSVEFSRQESLSLKKGESAVFFCGDEFAVAASENTVLFRAAVPEE